MIRTADISPPPATAPPCPGCGVATVPTTGATVAKLLSEVVLVECANPNCSRHGSRWTAAELLVGAAEPDPRPSWDKQFMDIAVITARRATCDRSHVGCVVVVDNRIVSTGYNGAFHGAEHCDDVGHLMIKGKCARTVHAEMNVVADAARRGVSIDGATVYLTREPCAMCLKLLVAAGVVRVVVAEVIKPSYLPEIELFAAAGNVDLCILP